MTKKWLNPGSRLVWRHSLMIGLDYFSVSHFFVMKPVSGRFKATGKWCDKKIASHVVSIVCSIYLQTAIPLACPIRHNRAWLG
jgi:hypothetical protein